jgi:hypothetical protein
MSNINSHQKHKYGDPVFVKWQNESSPLYVFVIFAGEDASGIYYRCLGLTRTVFPHQIFSRDLRSGEEPLEFKPWPNDVVNARCSEDAHPVPVTVVSWRDLRADGIWYKCTGITGTVHIVREDQISPPDLPRGEEPLHPWEYHPGIFNSFQTTLKTHPEAALF